MLTDEQLRIAMASAEMPSFLIDAIVSMAEGAYDIVTDDIKRLAGRSPRSLREVLAAV